MDFILGLVLTDRIRALVQVGFILVLVQTKMALKIFTSTTPGTMMIDWNLDTPKREHRDTLMIELVNDSPRTDIIIIISKHVGNYENIPSTHISSILLPAGGSKQDPHLRSFMTGRKVFRVLFRSRQLSFVSFCFSSLLVL